MTPIKLDEFLPYRIACLAHAITAAISHIHESRHGLSTPQWRVTAAVAEVPGRTAQDVVSVTPMEKAVVSRAVTALIRRGVLRREADVNDGRASRLFLTAKGSKSYADIAPRVRKLEQHLLAAAPDGDELLASVKSLEAQLRTMKAGH